MVNSDHTCSLYIANEKISEFSIILDLEVGIEAHSTYLDFIVLETEAKISIKDLPNYPIGNRDLGIHMVEQSLHRLKNHRVLGSGWKIFPRDYAHIQIFDYFVAISDSTHIAQ